MSILLPALLVSGFVPADPAMITGLYLEDRTMRVYACPCEWSTDWAHRGREAVMAWNILSGELDGTDLAGLRAAVVVLGRFALTEPASPRQSVIFIASDASPAQQRAGVAWLRSRYAPLLGHVVAVHDLPIEFTFDRDHAGLQAGGLLTVQMRRAEFPKDTQSWAQPIHDPFIRLTSVLYGITSRVSYTGPDLKIRWTREESAITGYFGAFSEPAEAGP